MKLRLLSFITAIAILPLIPRARAATIYSDLKDIAIPTTFAGVYLDLDAGVTSGAAFTGWDVNPFFGGVGIGNSAAFQPVRVGASHLDAVVRFYRGMTVTSGLTFASGVGGSGNPGHEHIGAGIQQFQVGAEGYLAFKFTTNASAGPLCGWMRVTLTNNAGGAVIRDWGYDDAGGAIVIGRVEQSAASGGAQTVTLSPEFAESFTLGSAIEDTGGNVNSILKTGAGSTTLGVANTFTGTTTVDGGTLEAGGVGALGETSGVIINAGGTLLLSGSGDRVNDAAGITLADGTLRTGGLAETVGALTLSASSIIDMGAGTSSLYFVDSHLKSWTGALSVWNWSGNAVGGGGTDQLFFGSSDAGLSIDQLNQISFFSGPGTGFLGTGSILGTGEITPVPEPSGVFLALGLLGLAGWREHGRARRKRQA